MCIYTIFINNLLFLLNLFYKIKIKQLIIYFNK